MTRHKSKHVAHLLHYETRRQPLISSDVFAKRLLRNIAVATILIGLSLFAGMLGYRYLEGMPWIDAFLNASMILSGMGPLGELQHWGAKLFAGLYALYSGLTLIIATGLILAPVLHRVMHRFHVEDDDQK